ncbi:unnamed protein product [Meloidogyne enterolobii]|uniref:Uncharacterized protein n=2 Tax=Meloidogyne enterolobii TaxID=390850 RepID=A0ACB0ZU33_MELEN
MTVFNFIRVKFCPQLSTKEIFYSKKFFSFDNNNVIQLPPTYVRQAPIFGFVAHKIPVNGNVENSCHMFAELDPGILILD